MMPSARPSSVLAEVPPGHDHQPWVFQRDVTPQKRQAGPDLVVRRLAIARRRQNSTLVM